MRRITHLTLGAAVAMPIAASLSPGIAVGCLWWGMVGGGFPDWFDLKSDFRIPLRLKHRGASHGLPVALLASAAVYALLIILSQTTFALSGMSIGIMAQDAIPWTFSFVLGVLSHLVSDSCTISGIRPLLPFSRFTFWAIPTFLRSRHDGYLDRLFFLIGLATIALFTIAYLTPRIA